MRKRIANEKGLNMKNWYKGDAFQFKFIFLNNYIVRVSN